jgi:hypothetical protein
MRRRRNRSGDARLGELVSRVYPASEPTELQAIRAFGFWERAMPARVVENARPVRLRRGTLVVHVRTSAWAQELSFLQHQILDSIQKHAPDAGVRDIRIRVGPVPDTGRARASKGPAPQAPIRKPTNLPEDVARALATVQDDDLRDAIARAAASSLEEK